MKIIYYNFLSYSEIIYDFVDNEIVLISGPSGIGKSTIFEGIYWCLYGKRKKMHNHYYPDKEYYVIMILKNNIIFRQGNPNLLKFISNIDLLSGNKDDILDHIYNKNYEKNRNYEKSEYYENDVAQEKIKEIFGTQQAWRFSSYIKQKGKDELLYIDNNKKMSLLNDIAFCDIDTESPIHKIEDKLKKLTKDFQEKQISYQTEKKILEENFKKLSINEDEKLNKDGLINLKEKLTKLEFKYNIFLDNYELYKKQLTEYELLNKSVIEIEQKLNSYELHNININIITQKKQKYTKLLSEIDSKQKIIEFEIDNLSNEKIHQFTNINNILRELQKKINNIQHINQEKILNIKLSIQSEKSKLKEHEDNLLKMNRSFEESKEKWNIYKQNISIIKKNILTIKPCIPVIIDENINYSKLLWLTQQQEKKYYYDCQIAHKYNLEFKSSIILSYIDKLEIEINMWQNITSHYKLYENILLLESDKNSINNELIIIEKKLKKDIIDQNMETSESYLNALYIKYNEFNNFDKKLICPNCDISLRFIYNKLLLNNTTIIPGKLSVIKEQIKMIKKAIVLKNKLYTINSCIDLLLLQLGTSKIPFDRPINIENFINEIKIKITELSDITTYCLPNPSTKEINDIIKYKQLIDELYELKKHKNNISINTLKYNNNNNNILSNIDNININIKKLICSKNKSEEKLNQEIQLLQSKINNYEIQLDIIDKNYIQNKNKLNDDKISIIKNKIIYNKKNNELNEKKNIMERLYKEKKIILNKLNIINLDHSIKKKVDSLYNKKTYIDQLIIKIEHYHSLLNWQLKVETKHEEIIELQKDITSLSILKTKAIDAKCFKLELIVKNINDIMGIIIKYIFNNPIYVTLKMYRQLKSKKEKIKPSVNFSIFYKGIQYNSIHALSGGEFNRVLFAFIIALNLVSGSPILILDEFLSELDDDVKRKCIIVLQYLTINRYNYLLEDKNLSVLNKINPQPKIILCTGHEEIGGYYDRIIYI